MRSIRPLLAFAVLTIFCGFPRPTPGSRVELPPPPRVDDSAGQAGGPRKPAGPPPVALPAPPPPAVSATDAFPLAAGSVPFAGEPPPDGAATTATAPVVFVAPFPASQSGDWGPGPLFRVMLRRQLQRSDPRDGSQLLNLVPEGHISAPYLREDGSGVAGGKPDATYEADARTIGADTLVLGSVHQGSDGSLRAELRMKKLSDGTVQTFEQSVSGPDGIGRLVGEAAAAVAAFHGFAPPDVTRCGFARDVPGPATWSGLLADPTTTSTARAARLLADDPGSLYAHVVVTEYGGEVGVKAADVAVRRWPSESMCVYDKAIALRQAGRPYAGLLLHAEALRRQPDNLALLRQLPYSLKPIDRCTSQSTRPPDYAFAALRSLEDATKRHPKNWALLWNYADTCDIVAHYARGSATADKVPDEMWNVFTPLIAIGTRSLRRAASIRPDCPDMLTRQLKLEFLNGNTQVAWQRRMIARILALDPSNVSAESHAAYSHSVGWGDDGMFLVFMTEAADRHSSDPRALAELASDLALDLWRQESFDPDRFKDPFTPNPTADLFIRCCEAALKAGYPLQPHDKALLDHIRRFRVRLADASALRRGGQGPLATRVQEAFDAREAGRWDEALTAARVLLPELKEPAQRQGMRYTEVKCLWKLKRYDEAMAAAELGFTEFPEKPTFHYMFAVVGLECGKRPDEALKHAQRAYKIEPENEGIVQTYSKLREKMTAPKPAG